ncbi:MAG: putative modification methylase [Parcubacteria group bacterium Gr01-1014_38]|nr:MAG: putative modification methylase [Parcubacteria group bacterium Gr01-1014_38]
MNFIASESRQKLRGGYYTPLDLATFLAKWVRGIKPKRILEPSCGDGIFLEAFSRVGGMKNISLLGLEIDKEEVRKARARARNILPNTSVYTEDFLGWALNSLHKGQRFDAIVGNPPFIRYQYLPKDFQQRAEEVFENLDLPFTKHANAWVPFVLASMALLRPGGRLAMVVPAEIMHITHAQPLRSYLGKECRRLVIVDPEELWFSDTLQGAVLLLAEKKGSPADKAEGVGIYPVKQKEFLNTDPEIIFSAPKSLNGRTIAGKWTYALLDRSARSLLDNLSKHPNVHHFKDIAEVDVGIVTGANNYFLVSDETVEEFGLSKWAHPMFGRSKHCPGVIYDEYQHRMNKEEGKPANFIWFSDDSVSRYVSAQKYIDYGEEQNLHTRYKCRVRDPWYSVPSVYTTEIGMLKRSHDAPRLILNKIGAFTTDTAYRISAHGVANKRLVGSFINSLTALSAELEGRHYGGGVLELVPSEIEKLLIPLPELAVNLTELDKDVKTLPMVDVLEQQDKKILSSLGLTKSEQNLLVNNWQRLHDRRQRVSSDSEIA